MQAVKLKTKNIFIRQPFTQTSEEEQAIISSVISIITEIGKRSESFNLNLLTGSEAYHKNSFINEWEKTTGIKFSPDEFRKYRLSLIDKSDAFINIRTGMSESGAFELAYNVFNKGLPIFFAVWENSPIRTTLLKDLDKICDATYVHFNAAEYLEKPLEKFLRKI
jgi:carbamoyl-phosphate synthase large subunit